MSADVHRRPTTAETVALLARATERPSRLTSNLNLVRELAVASFKLKYSGSALGYLWSLMRPSMIFGMLYLVFVLFLLKGRTAPGENFPVELLVGIVAWTYFAEATTSSVSAVVSNADMVLKAQFPRWILVVASTAAAAMTLAVNFGLVLTVGLIFHWFAIGWQSLAAVLLLLELVMLSLGVGLILAAGFVFYRDLGYIWEVLLLLLFYGSAIIFPFTLVPQNLQRIVGLNPLAQIVEDLRRALVSPVIPWSGNVLGSWLAIPVFAVCLSVVIGALAFTRLSRTFGNRL
jgi:ABC-2 type transport system permease protein